MKFLAFIFIVVTVSNASAQDSTCYGTTSRGKLENGVKIPLSGKNFQAYSTLLWGLGRTYVHSSVRDVLVQSYENLFTKLPSKKFVYAETGFKDGGPFKPHKTHQNGLSVDLMVPTVVPTEDDKSTPFKMNASNRFGYDVEFNGKGVYQKYKIDFDALGALIVEVYEVAKKQEIRLWRVIFAPDLQPFLHKTQYGDFIKKNISVPTKKSWVRHDEHIHIDFKVPCEKLN